MCVLLISWRQRVDHPLLLAANRDEAYARPCRGPERVQAGGTRALAPRDLVAGGTWIGLTAAGLVVAITNRRDGDFDPARPSRGRVCRLALEQDDAAGVQRFLEAETRARRYNSFNLLHADRERALVSCWNGKLTTVELRAGVAVLTNEHGPGELTPPAVEALQDERGGIDVLRESLRRFLGRHAPESAGGLVICKHGDTYGTVSSSLVFLPESTPGWLEHAPGPACRTPFTVHTLHDRARVL